MILRFFYDRAWGIAGILGLMLFCTQGLQAQEIFQRLSNGRIAVADYQPGEIDKPAVFLLHGFLQSYNFGTVATLADELASQGFTVLRANLSLGIDKRKTALSCDAIHTHTLQQGRAEIGDWINWLIQRGHHAIVLIGHSSGSQRLLDYATHSPPHEVRHFIGLSMGHMANWNQPKLFSRDIDRASAKLRAGDKGLANYTLGFCNRNFNASATSFLSYASLDQKRILSLLNGNRLSSDFVFGGNDRRVPPHWANRIKSTGANIHIIPEASHFFDGTHEFALHDKVMEILERLNVSKTATAP